MNWFIYIPEEGDWPINYHGKSYVEAKQCYLKWSRRIRLPKGSRIWFR